MIAGQRQDQNAYLVAVQLQPTLRRSVLERAHRAGSLGAHTGGWPDYLRNRRDREMGAPPAGNRAASGLAGNNLMVCDVI